MSDLFLNPWSMAAGALLVAVPIIIHLINRIRFRRVRWAAMEFLLKAQKRMRRKLILQQLLLLLMRCLMVLMIGLIVGRFAGCDLSGEDTRSTAHIVLLDDGPSMADGWRNEDGTTTDPFLAAQKVLTEQIGKAALEATTPQTVDVYRLSDLATPREFGRLNPTALEEMKSYLASYKPSTVRVGLVEGLKAVKKRLDREGGDVGKVVHVLTDLRAIDWSAEGESIKEVTEQLTQSGVKVYLIDTAHPFRKKDDRRAPLAHDNIGITELKPSKLVVARYDPLEFTLRVRNYGTSELKGVRFAIKVNGDENKGRSVMIPTLPGNQERSVKFEVPFDRVGSEDRPLDRFSLVTATLESGEPGGIAADNVRHAVVEVQERLPILVIEESADRESRTADGFYLRPVFNVVLSGYSWRDGRVADLEKEDLSRYAFVFVLNVPKLSDLAIKNLEAYVKDGGGVGFFLGDKIVADHYNKSLYRDGEGLFPVPLADKPSPTLSEEELQIRRFRISQKKLLVRDAGSRSHPALAGLYTDERGEPIRDAEQLERVYGFITIKQYWPVPRLGKWREDRSVAELYCMPNEQPMSSYEKPTRDVARSLQQLLSEPAFAKYKETLGQFVSELERLASSSDPLYRLGAALDDMLLDQQSTGSANEAVIREFWSDPRTADLRTAAARLRDTVKFGDPFYLAKDFGRGRVTLVTTTAGEAWTDWPSERPGNASYTPILKEMGNYLSGAGADETRAVGDPLEVRLDAGRYRPTARRAFVTHDPETAGPRGAAGDPAPFQDLKDQPLIGEGDKLIMRFSETARPGAYLFTFTNIKPQGGKAEESGEVLEYRAFAANLDPRESDLRRATRDDVTLNAPGAEIQTAADPDWVKALRNRRTDFSESIWPYLMLFLLLAGELLLATALSFHASSAELAAAAPSAASAMQRSTPRLTETP